MRIAVVAFMALILSVFTACQEPDPIIIDTSMPQGTFVSQRSGSIVEQNGTGSKGTAELGTDGENVQFLHFGSDFETNIATGTVTVYLSTSKDYVADPGNGNPDLLLVGGIKSNGESYFKIAPAAASKFTHVILWCGSASIPFGYAELK